MRIFLIATVQFTIAIAVAGWLASLPGAPSSGGLACGFGLAYVVTVWPLRIADWLRQPRFPAASWWRQAGRAVAYAGGITASFLLFASVLQIFMPA